MILTLVSCTRTYEERGTEAQEPDRLAHTGIAVQSVAPHSPRPAPCDDTVEGVSITTRVDAFTALLGGAGSDPRHPAWNAYNNPDVLGPLGCWYFSETYQAMTNPVLSGEDIAVVICNAPAMQDLLWLGQQLFDGDMMVRDIHAARALYAHVVETAPDEETRMYALRFLAETWASALTAERDYSRALPLFQQVFEHLLERGDAARNIDANINLHWALYGLMECYDLLEMPREKAAVIAAYSARAPELLNTAGAVAFGEVLIRHHHPPKEAAALREIADAYDRVARDYYADDASHAMVQKCRLFSGYFRQLAGKVAVQEP